MSESISSPNRKAKVKAHSRAGSKGVREYERTISPKEIQAKMAADAMKSMKSTSKDSVGSLTFEDLKSFDYTQISDQDLSALRRLLSAESDRRYPRV